MVELEKFNNLWAKEYTEIKNKIWPYLGGVAVGIEHIGATAINGVTARPIIDIDLIVASNTFNKDIHPILEKLGYQTNDDINQNKPYICKINEEPFAHRLSIVAIDSLVLKSHLNFRNLLLKDPELVKLYNEVKTKAAKSSKDQDYNKQKSPMMIEVMKFAGFSGQELENLKKIFTSL